MALFVPQVSLVKPDCLSLSLSSKGRLMVNEMHWAEGKGTPHVPNLPKAALT